MKTQNFTDAELTRFSRLRDRKQIAWKELNHFLTSEEFHFDQKKDLLTCEARYQILQNVAPIPFCYRVSTESDRIELAALIIDKFDEIRLHEILLLACHFNEILQTGHVDILLPSKRVVFQTLLPLNDLILEEEALRHAFYSHMSISQDVTSAYLQLLEDLEDPVVIIGNVLRKAKTKNEQA